MSAMEPNPNEQRLDALFAAYREATPGPEPTPDFIPGLWRKIESRRSATRAWNLLTRTWLTAAAALCLGMALLLGPVPGSGGASAGPAYLEISAEDVHGEHLAYADLREEDEELPQ